MPVLVYVHRAAGDLRGQKWAFPVGLELRAVVFYSIRGDVGWELNRACS